MIKRNKEVIINIIAMIIFAMIPILIYFKFITNDMLLISGDGAGYYSIRNYFNNILRMGEFPLWNKYLEGGMAYGAYDSVGLYPIALLLSFLSPSALSFAFYFIHLFIGAFFCYKFLQEIKCSKMSALITSIIYETSIHLNGARKSHIMLIVGVIYLPVILYLVQKYINTKKHYWLIGSAIAMGFQFLGAHTQIVVYTDIAVFVYLISYLIKEKIALKRSIIHIITWLFTYLGVILAQLVATFAVFLNYLDVGKKPNSFENFSSYSIHFCKLLQMVFPNIFGDIYMAFSENYSSGMDIEIYLGLPVLLCIVFCIIKFHNYFIVKLSAAFMIIAFLYSALGHIPFLAKTLYQIPVINGFRVPSRALFIFIFFAFVLFAVIMTECKNKEVLYKFLSFILKSSFILLAIIILTYSIILCLIALITADHLLQIETLEDIFVSTVITCIIIIISSLIIKHYISKELNSIKTGYYSFIMIILFITIYQTYPYSIITSSVSSAYFDTKTSKVVDSLSKENYKIIDAFATIDGSHDSLIGLNSAVDKKITGINAYLTYNNPFLYRVLTGDKSVSLNYSGLMTGFLNMQEILSLKNDLLSILGIKYIIDSSNILTESPFFITDFMADKLVHEEIGATYSPAELNIHTMNFKFKANTFYKIELDVDTLKFPEGFYLDVVNSSGIDGYNRNILDTEDGHAVCYYITPPSNSDDLLGRLVMINDSTINLSNIKIFEGRTKYPEYNLDTIFFTDINNIIIPANTDTYSLYCQDIELKPDTYYYLQMNVKSDSVPSFLYVDMYASGYDNAEQQLDIVLTDQQPMNISKVFNSGDCPEKVQLRIVSNCASDVIVNSLSICETKDIHNRYIEFSQDQDGNIYVNPNAKDILFTTPFIETISSNEALYNSLEDFNLLDTTYVLDYKSSNISTSETQISDIVFNTNNITATVDCKEETFINFSQCWANGWKAYVDGKKTNIYLVDGVIMGMAVPQGNHTIEFRFRIPFFYPAIFISCCVIIFWIGYFIIIEYKDKKSDNKLRKDQKNNENSCQ